MKHVGWFLYWDVTYNSGTHRSYEFYGVNIKGLGGDTDEILEGEDFMVWQVDCIKREGKFGYSVEAVGYSKAFSEED